jgi:gliding motility-associated-like protein
MKYILLHISLLFIPFSISSQCNNVAIDLNTWTPQGGTWNVNGAGTSVNQTVNGGNVYFLSPQPFINVTISGTLRTADTDDDNMGFVFGVEGTIGTAPFHYYVFEWDQGGNGNGMYVKEFDQTGLVSTPLALVGNHWTRNFNHNFTLSFQSSRIVITMDGTTVLDIDGCFNPGKFGFFNRSQANVTYSNFQYLPISDFLFVSNDSICINEQAATDIFCLNNNLSPYSEFRWDFGDGTIVPNVSSAQHTYTTAGTYNIELYVKDFFGCEDSIIKPITVFDPSFTLGPDQTICPGAFDATFTSSNTTAGNIYNWSSGENTPSITKNASGQFILTLTDLNGCVGKDTANLTVGALPPVDFTTASECIYDSVIFTNNTVGAQSFLWDFGDGATSTLESPNHKYNNTGNYSIKLISTFGQGCQDSITKNISIFEAPIADFSSIDDCFNVAAIFNNQSSITTGTITSNSWDFGDGSNGILEDESHQYTSEGNYNVTLIVTSDNLCYDTVSKSFDRHAIPTINYTLSNECLYDNVLFTNSSSVNAPSNIQDFEWNFGDGMASAQTSPSHQYTNAGTFNTKLIGTTQFGCRDSLEQQVIIFDVPLADFTYANDCYNELATFTNQSNIANGSITDWSWSFGDGLDGNLENETHQYSTDGDFQVELIVTSNNNCVDSVEYTITRYPLPIPAYIANSECVYDEVQFNDNSTINAPDVIQDYEWSFGLGLTDNNQNPTILFPTAGTNQVKLVVISNRGCKDSISGTIAIYYEPTADFTTVDACNNIPASFTDNSTIINDNITDWEWNLGDGTLSNSQNLSHQYTDPNTYPVQLIVTTNNNCKDTIQKDLIRFPIPIADLNFVNQCLYSPLEFNNQSNINLGNTIENYAWNFGDGTPIDLNENSVHQYASPGTYQVGLTVISNNNCMDDTSVTVEVFPVPQVNFNSDPQCINIGNSGFGNLSVISSGSFSEWEWDFGDGTSSQLPQPSHQFSSSGVYTVSLIGTTNNNCSDTIIKTIEIYNKPSANFSLDQTNGCIPFCLNFTDLSTDDYGINFWEWNFENNSNSFQQFPVLCLTSAGDYDVSLIVTNLYNCKDTITQLDIINAWPNPIANFELTDEVIDVLNPFVTITNTSFDAEQWFWNLGNGRFDSINYNIDEVYDTPGNYEIDLAVENQYGCRDSIAKELKVLSKTFYYVPNSFTPNGDGINDAFRIEYEDLNFVSIRVYDRWGKQVFFTESIDESWDGTLNGKPLKTGTFAWILKYLDKQNSDQIEKGSVTLIK